MFRFMTRLWFLFFMAAIAISCGGGGGGGESTPVPESKQEQDPLSDKNDGSDISPSEGDSETQSILSPVYPDSFSTDYLDGRIFYEVTYGEGVVEGVPTDNIPVIKALTFDEKSITILGLKNSSDFTADLYEVIDGKLKLKDQFFAIEGATGRYLTSREVDSEGKVIGDRARLYFNMTEAYSYANILSEAISENDETDLSGVPTDLSVEYLNERTFYIAWHEAGVSGLDKVTFTETQALVQGLVNYDVLSYTKDYQINEDNSVVTYGSDTILLDLNSSTSEYLTVIYNDSNYIERMYFNEDAARYFVDNLEGPITK